LPCPGWLKRLRGAASLATERHRNLAAPEPQRTGRDADELEAEAEGLRAQEDELQERLAQAREQLDTAVAQRTQAEAAVTATERRLAASARAAAERADRLARLRGQAEAAASKAAAAQGEAGRLSEAFEQAQARAEDARARHEEMQELVSGRAEGRDDLTAEREQAAARLKEVSATVARLRKAEHAASGELAALSARADALAEAVNRGADASAVLLAESAPFAGVLGPLAALLTVDDGAQDAITAALGVASGAVAVAGLDAAADILAALRSRNAGQAGLIVTGGPARPGAADGLPAGLTAARDLVKAPADLTAAVDELLAGVAVADDLADGLALLREHPHRALRVVTRDGDLLGRHWGAGRIGRRAEPAEPARGGGPGVRTSWTRPGPPASRPRRS